VFPERALDDRVGMVPEGTGPRGNEVVRERRFSRRENRASLAGNTSPLYLRGCNLSVILSEKACGILFGYASLELSDYMSPWSSMASATFTKPAILAPTT
jgi:hypothetical protein